MESKKLTKRERSMLLQLRKKLKQTKSAKRDGIGLTIAGFAFILIFGNIWMNRNHEIQQAELKIVEGIVTNELALQWHRSFGYFLTIQLNGYPDVDFIIRRLGIKALKINLLQSSISSGDSIMVYVAKEDFAKISQNPDRERTITVYGVRDRHNEYLNISEYNKEFKKSRNSLPTYLLLGFSFWAFGYGIFLWIKNSKLATDKVSNSEVN